MTGIGARYVYFRITSLHCSIWTFFSYGTAKSGVGISAMSVLRPDLMMRSVVPVIMAGIIAVSLFSLHLSLHCLTCYQIYGLVVSVLIASDRAYYHRECASATTWHASVYSRSHNVPLARLYSTRCWSLCWTCWSSCRLRYWYRRRRWCTRNCTAAKTVRRHGKLCDSLVSIHLLRGYTERVSLTIYHRFWSWFSLKYWVFMVRPVSLAYPAQLLIQVFTRSNCGSYHEH